MLQIWFPHIFHWYGLLTLLQLVPHKVLFSRFTITLMPKGVDIPLKYNSQVIYTLLPSFLPSSFPLASCCSFLSRCLLGRGFLGWSFLGWSFLGWSLLCWSLLCWGFLCWSFLGRSLLSCSFPFLCRRRWIIFIISACWSLSLSFSFSWNWWTWKSTL